MLPFRGLPSGDFGGGKLRTTPPFNFDEKWKNLKTGTGLVKVQARSLCLPVVYASSHLLYLGSVCEFVDCLFCEFVLLTGES